MRPRDFSLNCVSPRIGSKSEHMFRFSVSTCATILPSVKMWADSTVKFITSTPDSPSTTPRLSCRLSIQRRKGRERRRRRRRGVRPLPPQPPFVPAWSSCPYRQGQQHHQAPQKRRIQRFKFVAVSLPTTTTFEISGGAANPPQPPWPPQTTSAPETSNLKLSAAAAAINSNATDQEIQIRQIRRI